MPFPGEIEAAKASGTSFEAPDTGEGGRERLPKGPAGRSFWADKSDVSCKTEMLTPKGEHSFPCSTRVMFDGRISFDGIATVKTL
jgi:hypothetical protein